MVLPYFYCIHLSQCKINSLQNSLCYIYIEPVTFGLNKYELTLKISKKYILIITKQLQTSLESWKIIKCHETLCQLSCFLALYRIIFHKLQRGQEECFKLIWTFKFVFCLDMYGQCWQRNWGALPHSSFLWRDNVSRYLYLRPQVSHSWRPAFFIRISLSWKYALWEALRPIWPSISGLATPKEEVKL